MLYDADEFAREFRERFRRPPPWYELRPIEELEDLAWMLSAGLRMSPQTISLTRVLTEAMTHTPRSAAPEYWGATEPLDIAVRRLNVPTDGWVWLWWYAAKHAVMLRCRDAVEFQAVFWGDGSCLCDADGRWLLAGEHDRIAVFLDFRGRGRSDA